MSFNRRNTVCKAYFAIVCYNSFCIHIADNLALRSYIGRTCIPLLESQGLRHLYAPLPEL